VKRKKKHVVCSSSFTFVSHTHTHGTTLTLSRLIISWCCYCYNRFEWLYWLGKTFFLHGFDFAHKTLKFPITKTKTRLKKKLLRCLSFLFIEQISISPDLFISFIIWCADTNKTHRPNSPPPSRPYMCRERGERNPIVTCAIPHWTPPLWHASCLLTTAKPEIGRAHDTIVLFPVSFYSFFSPFFSTHTHTKAWKSSLTIFARPFLVLLSFLWTFSNNRKDQKTLQKKNAQTKTHLLYTTTTTTSLSNLVAAFLYYYFIFSLLKRFHPQTNILRLFFSLSHTHTRTPSPITNADDVMFSLPNALWCAAAAAAAVLVLMIKLDIRSNQLVPPLPDEIKDGQWLGVTVRSQGPGRKVLVSLFLCFSFKRVVISM
jgi:hypothetical protein